MIQPISIVVPFYTDGEDYFLWTQIRETKDELNGLMEFPGGKIDGNETPELAAIREVNEEVGIAIKPGELKKFKNYTYELKEKTILLMVYLFEDRPKRFDQSRYLKLNELSEMPGQIPPVNREILFDLKLHFG